VDTAAEEAWVATVIADVHVERYDAERRCALAYLEHLRWQRGHRPAGAEAVGRTVRSLFQFAVTTSAAHA